MKNRKKIIFPFKNEFWKFLARNEKLIDFPLRSFKPLDEFHFVIYNSQHLEYYFILNIFISLHQGYIFFIFQNICSNTLRNLQQFYFLKVIFTLLLLYKIFICLTKQMFLLSYCSIFFSPLKENILFFFYMNVLLYVNAYLLAKIISKYPKHILRSQNF